MIFFFRFEGCFENDFVRVDGLRFFDLVKRGNVIVYGKKIFYCNVLFGGYSFFMFLKFEFFIKIIVYKNNIVKYSFKFCIYSFKGILLF